MSMPNIPDIHPEIKICREEVIDLILASIGLEEISLAHIMNAEAEKLQSVIKCNSKLVDLLKIDRSVERMLRDVVTV